MNKILRADISIASNTVDSGKVKVTPITVKWGSERFVILYLWSLLFSEGEFLGFRPEGVFQLEGGCVADVFEGIEIDTPKSVISMIEEYVGSESFTYTLVALLSELGYTLE